MIKRHLTFKFLALSALVLSISMASPAFAESTGRYIDDATITAKVKAAILADSELSVSQIKVDTSHGTVTLSGIVDTKAQEAEAAKVAKLVDGVKSVTVNLSVKTTQAE